MTIIEELKNLIKGDVDNSAEALYSHSHDASLLEVTPEVVIYPKDVNDISNLVRFINTYNIANTNHKLHITARSGGTCMSGGSINTSIILDFTRYMNRLIEIDSIHKYAVIEPGLYYRDFEKETLKHNLIMPAYTASKMICAVGGMVANNSAGEKTIKYGKVENYITALQLVLSDGSIIEVKNLNKQELDEKCTLNTKEGEIYKNLRNLIENNYDKIVKAKPDVSKNSAGYYLWNVHNRETGEFDLCKLIVGSQGTLGIITKITWRLVDIEPYSSLLAIMMPDLSKLGDIVAEIVPFKPESIESYDDYSMKLAIRFWADFIKQMGLFGAIKLGVSFLPEMMMMVKSKFKGGKAMPKLILLVECGGHDENDVKNQLLKIKEKVAHYGYDMHVVKNSREAEKYWKIRRESFNMLRKHVKGLRTAPFIDDLCVKPEYLPEFMPKLEKILTDYKLIYTVAGHAGNGNFHIIPLMDLDSPFGGDLILEISDKVYTLVKEYGGSITAEHNDGIIRTPYLPQMYGQDIIDLFKETKEIFDPNYILNPGKKVLQGSVEEGKQYIKDHIIKSYNSKNNHSS
jgi:FAD/FMN-containing dehydrogenase